MTERNHKAGEPQEPSGEVKLTKKGDGSEVGMYSKEEQDQLKESIKAEKAEHKAEEKSSEVKREEHKK